ncbi:hypothetical protein SNEBB_000127 [Seison nebaliae]|nr:hypothetical protein SNEBB_000127 [Seison nebaliae]
MTKKKSKEKEKLKFEKLLRFEQNDKNKKKKKKNRLVNFEPMTSALLEIVEKDKKVMKQRGILKRKLETKKRIIALTEAERIQSDLKKSNLTPDQTFSYIKKKLFNLIN